MIVELIGCAGAGKSTLARMICERGIARGPVVHMPDLVRDRVLLRRIMHPTVVNVLQEVGGLPFFVASWGENRAFVGFARQILRRNAPTRFDELNCMRSIVRKVGMYRCASRRDRDTVVLSDEGTVLSAYNLFVMTNVDFGRREIESFVRLVPLPDRVVYVRAPTSTLVERAVVRPRPRRQHRGKTAPAIARDVERTIELFDLVSTTPALADRVLVVDNDDGDEAARWRLVDEIAAWLDASMTAHGDVEHVAGSLLEATS